MSNNEDCGQNGVLVLRFCDNGAFSHYQVIKKTDGSVLMCQEKQDELESLVEQLRGLLDQRGLDGLSVAELHRENAELKKRLQSIALMKREVDEELSFARAENAELKQERAELEEQKVILNRMIDIADTNIEQLTERLSALAELRKLYDAAMANNEAVKNDFHEKTEAFKKSITDDGMKIISLNQENAALKKLVEQAQQAMKAVYINSVEVVANASNTASVKKGAEMGGYIKYYKLQRKDFLLIGSALLATTKGGKP